MTKVSLYTSKGKSQTDLPKAVDGKINLPLLAQALRVYTDRKHPGLAKTKTRGQVVASTRKIYRQKGTGGARHGSISAPIFVGGGVAHGPKGVKRVLSLPQILKRKALAGAIALKAKEGKVVLGEIGAFKKTAEAVKFIERLKKEENAAGKFLFALSHESLDAKLALRNIKEATVLAFKDLNTEDVLLSGFIVLDKSAFGKIDKEEKEKKVGTAKRKVSNKAVTREKA